MNVRNQTFMESTFIFTLKISEICESECKLELFTNCQTDFQAKNDKRSYNF